MSDIHDYSSIINIKKPPSKHESMERIKRAAQFAPFAALTGYEESILETSRLVEKKRELSSDELEILERKINIIINNISKCVKITYFVPDNIKDGGYYLDKFGYIKRIDNINKKIIFKDNDSIDISLIVDIDSEIFNKYL